MHRQLVPNCTACIGYQPFINEPKYTHSALFQHTLANTLFLPQSKDADPFEWAEKCIAHFGDTAPCIFVPGSQFDIYGTRRGRGFGWYDRFLSKVPDEWQRIGVLFDLQLSHTALERKEHDEPVDWLLIKTDSGWHIKASRQQRA